jgi:hypothetical protein
MADSINIPPNTLQVGDLMKFLPEPKSALASGFGQILQKAFGGVSSVVSGTLEPGYSELIQEQIRQQIQMQLVSLISGTEKSKHETAMVPLRNITVR